VKIDGLEIDGREVHGEGGFLTIQRVHLRNQRSDGSSSEPYICDFASRPRGVDAVAVVVYRRKGQGVEVLMRSGLRPALQLGRTGAIPIDDEAVPLMLWEVVAGIIERGDRGEQGIRDRAAEEVWEEAGYRVGPDQIEDLGAPFYASPGSLCERVYAAVVEIDSQAVQAPLAGDGSPMEEGATTRWVELGAAIAECVAGYIQDLKTEVLLRRLRDALDDS
jgi:ADP-ribose pyrophosphatase